mgnify:CR=1 FL=1
MQIKDYPPQEPMSEAGVKCAEEVMGLCHGIAGEDHVFGEDPYHCFAVHVPDKANGIAGGAVSHIVFEGRNHFTASYAGVEADGPWVPLALRWMQAH